MTTLIDHPPAQRDHQSDQRDRVYHDVFAWPTTIDNVTGEVRLRLGTVVDALIMRAGFAAEVNNVLVRHMFRAPIITVPGNPADWIFITRPRTTLRQSVWEDLMRIQVGWKRRGQTILLPALDNTTDGVRWLEQPQQHADLPPWTAVVAAARKASSVCGAW
ncbi:hypothetical protein [Prauserella flavalba]|uniref:Uncharacterized protein n=1 Tax=Prauserella flavalba TaxID=1477506 RepID=A0A318LFT0_9PSEU|nr:hypothetical protein [Prauserella flavalba]PXY16969.1 hypothetical protein BA062_37955 [Prauserella flavalba]